MYTLVYRAYMGNLYLNYIHIYRNNAITIQNITLLKITWFTFEQMQRSR